MKINNLSSLEFNVFEYTEDKSHLIEVAFCLLNKNVSLSDLCIDPKGLKDKLLEMSRSYNELPYHNLTHAVDVMQFVSYLIENQCCKDLLMPLDRLSLLLSAFGHDMGHRGLNNAFLRASEDKLIEKVGSKSPLEEYSIYLLHKYIKHYKLFIPKEGASIQKDFLHASKALILATDMDVHDELMRAFTQHIQVKGLLFNTQDEKLLYMKMLLKLSDMSNVLRKPKISAIWQKKIYQEFSDQAQLEKQRNFPPMTPVVKGTVKEINQVQLLFIEKVLSPLYEAVAPCIENLDKIHLR